MCVKKSMYIDQNVCACKMVRQPTFIALKNICNFAARQTNEENR